jgi:hypothetical protein
MRDECLAGSSSRVPHVGPFRGIVEGLKNHSPNQGQAARGERVAKHGRLLGHISDWTELDALIASVSTLVQHPRPGWIARIIGKLDAMSKARLRS